MQIQLQRQLPLHCLRVLGTISEPVERLIEQGVLLWVQEWFEKGECPRIEQLCDAQTGLFPKRPLILAQSVIDRCESQLGLLKTDAQGQVIELTEAGQIALHQRSVYLPKQGTWEIWWSDDPLLNLPVLHITEYQEMSAHQYMQQNRRSGSQPQTEEKLVDIPQTLTNLKDQILNLPVGGRSLRIDELHTQGKKVAIAPMNNTREFKLTLTIDSAENSATVELQGTFENQSISTLLKPRQLDFAGVWQTLLHQEELVRVKGIHQSLLALPRSFETLCDSTRITFQDQVTLKQPELPELGCFETTVVQEVPVVPASELDAQRWFEWLLEAETQDYQTLEVYHQRTQKLLERFPNYRISIPQQQELAAQLRSKSYEKAPNPRYWYLQAPLDLNLEVLR